MLGRELASGARRHPNHHRDRELAARHVPDRRGVVHDLVDAEQAEIDRHDLDDRLRAAERGADGRADEGRFRERRVANAFLAELGEQPLADGVAAAVPADVLAHQKHALIAL